MNCSPKSGSLSLSPRSQAFYKVPVEAVAELILALTETIPLEALSLADYKKAVREARRSGVMGSGIYDSLHATFAA